MDPIAYKYLKNYIRENPAKLAAESMNVLSYSHTGGEYQIENPPGGNIDFHRTQIKKALESNGFAHIQDDKFKHIKSGRMIRAYPWVTPSKTVKYGFTND